MSKQRLCASCDNVMPRCPCSWKKTTDGHVVHHSCYQGYIDKQKGHGKCAYCNIDFIKESYYQAMNGRAVHLSCQQKYENELIKNK